MRRRFLLPAARVAAGFVLGACAGGLVVWLCVTRPTAATPVAVGTPITVHRPTGEVVAGDGRDIPPAPVMQTTRVVVYRVYSPGRAAPVVPAPQAKTPWRIVIGDPPNQTVLMLAVE